jgi:hypothetical protein
MTSSRWRGLPRRGCLVCLRRHSIGALAPIVRLVAARTILLRSAGLRRLAHTRHARQAIGAEGKCGNRACTTVWVPYSVDTASRPDQRTRRSAPAAAAAAGAALPDLWPIRRENETAARPPCTTRRNRQGVASSPGFGGAAALAAPNTRTFGSVLAAPVRATSWSREKHV